eukprot:2786354-Alexandrium_andersonii.AAC.1
MPPKTAQRATKHGPEGAARSTHVTHIIACGVGLFHPAPLTALLKQGFMKGFDPQYLCAHVRTKL